MNAPAIISEVCGYFTGFALIACGYVIPGIAFLIFISLFFVPYMKTQAEIMKNLLNNRGPELKRIDMMTMQEFIKFITSQFAKLGYHVVSAGNSDYDADLIVTLQGNPRTLIIVRHSINHTGMRTLQNALPAKTGYGCKRVIVLTNGLFTKEAKYYAKKNEIILWGRDKLKYHLCGRCLHMIEDDCEKKKIAKTAG